MFYDGDFLFDSSTDDLCICGSCGYCRIVYDLSIDEKSLMEEKKMEAYCTKCKVKVEVKDPVKSEMPTAKGMKHIVKGSCPKCATKVAIFVKA